MATQLRAPALDTPQCLPYLPRTSNGIRIPPFVVNDGVRKPSLGAALFGLIPFIAMCFSVSLWDRVYPMVLGLPFNLFWLVSWILLTPLCMWGAYVLETRARMRSPRSTHGRIRGANQ